MKIIGFILFFNKSFMSSFTTTIGKTVYFPSKEKVEEKGDGALLTLLHEYRHAKDSSKLSTPLFSLAYLFPQILAPFMLFFGFINWWLAIALFILFLAPLPAPFRAYFEFNAYVVTLFVTNLYLLEHGIRAEDRKKSLIRRAEKINNHFINANYYFMWPFGVKNKLKEKVDKIINQTIKTEDSSLLEIEKAFKNSNN